MNNFISEDPTQPSYYFPVIAGYLSLMVVLYFITSFLKSKFSQDHAEKMSNSFFQETLDPTKIYHENIVDKKNSLKARYIVAYVLTRASMWAKSPYLYTLFTKIHGFTMAEIGILYVVDGISALISGPILGNLADIFGRKFFCLMYCVTTVINLAIRVTGNHPMAYFAQVLTGIGAGLINTTFESWVNCSARNTFKDASPNPEENFKAMERFLKKLFKTQNILDAIMSVFVSFCTAILYTFYGILAPIIVSILFASLAFFIILVLWEENKPNEEGRSHITQCFGEALNEMKKREVLTVGIIESLFLAVHSIFLFAWTPILTNTVGGEINVGIIFVCFVMSMITGTMLFEVNNKITQIILIYFRLDYFKTIVVFFVFESTLFYMIYSIDSFTMRVILLSMINGCFGFYNPLNSIIKTKILEEKFRALLMNIFRIPLNIYVIVVLLFLKYLDPFTICLIACIMISIAFIVSLTLAIWEPKLKNK